MLQMNWLIAISVPPIDWTKNPLFDLADVVYSHFWDFVKFMDSLRSYPRKEKVLVLFCENPYNIPTYFKDMFDGLSELRSFWKGDIIVTGPTDEVQRYIVQKALRNGNYFGMWTSLPLTQVHYYKGMRGELGDYYMAWAYNDQKGLNLLKKLSQTVNVKIFNYDNSNPTSWCEEMLNARGLVWAASLESIGRTIVSAGALGKPIIMYRVRKNDCIPQVFNNYEIYGTSKLFYSCADVCDNYTEWEGRAGWTMLSYGDAKESGDRVLTFFKVYDEFWDWRILYQKFYDMYGIKLPKDMTVCHHLPPNFYTVEMIEDKEKFPAGPWDDNPISLNWRCS